MIFFIIILAIFFAMNMGGASFGAAFATAYGGKILTKKMAGVLFVLFVLLGSFLLGKNVAVTLGENIVPAHLITPKALAIIFFSAGLSMFVANQMHIPQSTSLVTVAAIAGVGAYFKQVDLKTIYYLIPFWIALPLLSYFLTHYFTGLLYPPSKKNYWVYERFVNHKEKLKRFVICANCYNAFSVGTNNVANVVGPLMALGKFTLSPMLIIFALFYGTGAFIFKGSLKTAGDKIVPLGLLTATIISIVSGTLMIIASSLGVPQSFVMLKMGAIFAVSSLKEGHSATFNNPLTKKTLYTWTINPVITFFLSYGLMKIF
ncbi:hypothetical protein MNBD_UNCLBAC01-1798 [hydrothermal vent metagenome]|uniref:Low-affinity inorganic phosphate transporter n=1 Tax=hydrothermal vent metagenome TaxID=652676 RepID=A0A3B1DG67_9ZZZZ